MNSYALELNKIIGCNHYSRVDLRMDGDNIFILELNTLPGMTNTSLFPKSAKIFGLVPPILLLFFYFLNNLSEKSLKKDTINFILFISFSTIIFTYIFWPYLWMDPF